MQAQAFTAGQTISLAVTTATVSANFTGGNVQAQSCILQNAGTAECFVRFSMGSSSAVTTDFPMLPGAIMTLCKGISDTVSAICATGSTTLRATAGEGQ